MDMQQQRILVVEDERIVATDIQRNLQRLGYLAPDAAASCEEALRFSSEAPPDLVLMDIRIEGDSDGIQTASLLRERYDVPIVFLTAYADAPTLKRATEVQPYGYLLKPVRPDELRTTVEIALHKHRVDKRLRERERWYATTMRSIADGIVTVDPQDRVTYMNPAAESLSGRKMQHAEGRTSSEVVELLDITEQPLSPTPIERALRERTAVNVPDAVLRQHDTGHLRHISDSASVVAEGDRVLGAVMVFRDTTEQHKLQEQLLASDRMATIGLLAAGVAHEINNPLAAAVISLDLATQATETLTTTVGAASMQSLQQDLKDAAAACGRIRSIVGDLRVFSRSEPIVTQEVSVSHVMESTLRLARAEIRHRARVVRVSQPTPPIQAIESRLSQVFLNLIVNAAQAIPEGNADRHEIRITTGTADDGDALVEIEDTGSGMSPETMARLFSPFFTTKPASTGTGLGLMLCRRIIDDLHGTIDIDSAVGRGTRVRLTFPPSREPKPAAPVMADAPPIALGRANVLVIDDDPIVAGTLQRAMRDVHDVTTITDAKTALARLQAGETFDVILCDLMMPTMTGMDLHDALNKTHPQVAAQIAFMTGGAFTPRAQEFLDTVGNPRIEKPFDRQKLLRLIGEMFERLRRTRS